MFVDHAEISRRWPAGLARRVVTLLSVFVHRCL
jgi:hypothetical protein